MSNYKNFKKQLLKDKEVRQACKNLGFEVILGNKSENILPLDVQREYIQYHEIVDSQELPEAVLLNESKKLFLKQTSLDEKKKILYLLAHQGNDKAYQQLQKYAKKPDKQLKSWAELCLQESAANLGSELLNQEETVMAISPAGGDGQRLRHYFVFSSAKSKLFTISQKGAIKKSVKAIDKKLHSKTEKLDFGENHVLTTVLIPMDVAADEYFLEIYKATSGKKEILRYHYYSTNVQKPSALDIQEYIKDLKQCQKLRQKISYK